MSATPAARAGASAQGERPLAAYQAMCEHAELELELAGRGEIEALVAIGARWGEIVAALPPRPPAAAAPLLERARLMHARTRIELVRLRDALLADFATASRARRTADGYAGQLRARPRVDQRA